MIAFVGSVFSPYYAWARRRGAGDPSNHCAINVALYGAGSQRWAMTERGSEALTRDGTSFTLGPSSVQWRGDALVVDIDEVAVPLPRRIKGRLTLRPDALTPQAFALDPDEQHLWWPVAPSARLEVAFEKPALHWRGHGYHDSNWGEVPLEDSFLSWTWSRAHLTRETAILYDVVPANGPERGLALRFDERGDAQSFAAPPAQGLPRGLWGVERATRVDNDHQARVVDTLEDAPFYLRSTLSTHLLGQAATAMHESLSLRRFDKAWVQALLPFRMPRRAG